MNIALIAGSEGFVGSEAVLFFSKGMDIIIGLIIIFPPTFLVQTLPQYGVGNNWKTIFPIRSILSPIYVTIEYTKKDGRTTKP